MFNIKLNFKVMKKLYVLFFTIFILFSGINAQDFPSTLANDLQFVLDNHINATVSKGVAATVILSDGSEWTGSSGIQNGSVPIDTAKLFNFGSQAKELTAITVLKLQEAGLLSVNDSIGTYLKGY